jgi:hypothetical protein
MEHTAKDGSPKILNEVHPAADRHSRRSNMIVTNMAVFVYGPQGLVLTETAPGVTVAEVKAARRPLSPVSPAIKEMACVAAGRYWETDCPLGAFRMRGRRFFCIAACSFRRFLKAGART